jgi:ABC-2 type transport system permease protein
LFIGGQPPTREPTLARATIRDRADQDDAPRPEPATYALPMAEDLAFTSLGGINVIGLWTLYLREIRRFLKLATQTLAAPVVTTLIFLAVFSLALGRAGHTVAGLPFLEFLAPGLIMMAIIQNAFANTSSSLIISKVQGNIVDLLMPPLGPGELTFGLVAGGVTRGVLVGIVVYLALLPFVAIVPAHPALVLFYAVAASLMLSLLGVLAGLWAEKFDQMQAVTNFVIMPLSFLSGTFYSIDALPEPFHAAAYVNPFFYMIDGMRFAFTGHADAPIALGIAVLVALNALLWTAAHLLIARGYRLKR